MAFLKHLFVIVLLIFLSFNTLSLELPENLLAIKDYNQDLATEYLKTISYPIAFIAGVLSFMSPCILPIIPAFFAITFKQGKKLTQMTFIFSLGFSSAFVVLGMLAAKVGQSIVGFQGSNKLLIEGAGFLLVLLGLMTISGRGFGSLIKNKFTYRGYSIDVFIMGILFAIGWSACLGPILSGILLIAMVFENYLHAGLLMFVYSLGIFVPFFIISVFYDRFNLSESRWIKGTKYVINIGGRKFSVHSTQMISGIILIIIGVVFVVWGGTSIVNNLSFLSYFKIKWYMLQERLLDLAAFI